MTDITKIPSSKLLEDLKETLEDIIVCKNALANGVTHYSSGSVQNRLDVNRRIEQKIRSELADRGEIFVQKVQA